MTVIKLAHLTSPEAGAIGGGGAIGLISAGAIEQHGPHLPLSMDTLCAESLADAVAERIGYPVVVPPVMPVGLSDPHVEFPGTVTIEESAFCGVLTGYVEALSRIGISRVAMLSGHGSNYACLGRFARAYTAANPGSEVIAHPSMEEFRRALVDGAHAAGLKPVESDAHAGLIETSIALHIRGELVRDSSEVRGLVTDDPSWEEKLIADGLRAVSPTGILGDPGGAAAAAGAVVLDVVADRFADWICALFSLKRAA